MVLRYRCFLYESKGVEEAQKLLARFDQARNPDPGSKPLGAVLNGKAISLPLPAYPPEARGMRADGVVLIEITIDETGKVIDAKSLCGHPILAKASLTAALAARFTPTRLSGMPVKVKGVIIYNFVHW
jgi:protein TonB